MVLMRCFLNAPQRNADILSAKFYLLWKKNSLGILSRNQWNPSGTIDVQ